MKIKFLSGLVLFLFVISAADSANLKVRGIYISQYTLENTGYFSALIRHAKDAGINTLIIDLERPNKKYERNLGLLKQYQMEYVARIVMFPNGASPYMVNDPLVWQKKYELVQKAVEWGASQIQLDYIRYFTKQRSSKENAKNILEIIKWYKNKLVAKNIPLQVDVFGIASFGEESHIGQNIKLFAQSVDAVCPMVYPSHFVPYPEHFKHPYDTVLNALLHIKKQFSNKMSIKMYPYIELSNYHYPMPHWQKLNYIRSQIKAVEKAEAEGWYAWSPHNRYESLFAALND